MANDNRIELVAGLDVDGSVKEISTQLEKEVSPAVNAKQALKITCTLDTKNIAGLQKQLSELSKGVKLDINAGTTSGITKQVKSDVDAIIEQFNLIGKNIGDKKSDLRKALEEPIKEFKEAYSTGDIEAAWTKLSSIIAKASKEIYTDNEVLLEQQKNIREQLSQIGKFHIDEKTYGDLQSIVGDDTKKVLAKVFGVGKATTTSRKGEGLDAVASEFKIMGLDADDLAGSIVKLYNILNQDPGKISVFETFIDEAGNATAAIDAVAAALKLPTGQYEEIAGGVYATEQFSEIEKEAPKAAQAIELIGEAYRDTAEQTEEWRKKQERVQQDYEILAAKIKKSNLDINEIATRDGVNYNEIFQNVMSGDITNSGDLSKAKDAVAAIRKEFQLLNAKMTSDLPQNVIENLIQGISKADSQIKVLTIDYEKLENPSEDLVKSFERLQTLAGKFDFSDNLEGESKENIESKIKDYTQLKVALNDTQSLLKAFQKEEKKAFQEDNRIANRSNRIKTLTANMNAYAAANKRAVDSTKQMSSGKTFAEEWVRLTTQMAKGAELTDQEIRNLNADFRVFGKEAEAAGLKGESAFGKFLNSFKTMSSYITANMVFNAVKRQVRELVNEVTEVDTAMTELRKVTDASDEDFERFAKSAGQTGRELGASVSDVINATATFARLGESLPDAEELGRVATLFKNVGDGITEEEAAEDLISTMKAFKIEAKDAITIVDKFNEVDTCPFYILIERNRRHIFSNCWEILKSFSLPFGKRRKPETSKRITYGEKNRIQSAKVVCALSVV